MIYAVIATLLVAACSVNGQSYCNSTMACPTGSTCYVYSPCKMGGCVCNPGYKQDITQSATTCVTPSINVGATCTKDAQCKGNNTACTSGVCSCSSSAMVPNSANNDCVLKPFQSLNGMCNSAAPNCSLSGAFCNNVDNNYVCQCISGYKPASNNIDCIPLQPNDPCSNSTDCPSNSICPGATCSSGKYQCLTGYSWQTIQGGSSYCLNGTFTADLGQSCDVTNNIYCKSSLFCLSACPEHLGKYHCVNGVPQQLSSAVSLKQEITTAAVVAATVIAIMFRLA